MTSKLAETFALFALAGSTRSVEDLSGRDRPRRRDQSKTGRLELVAPDDDGDEPWADNRLW